MQIADLTPYAFCDAADEHAPAQPSLFFVKKALQGERATIFFATAFINGRAFSLVILVARFHLSFELLVFSGCDRLRPFVEGD
jgi:hypothetical protein